MREIAGVARSHRFAAVGWATLFLSTIAIVKKIGDRLAQQTLSSAPAAFAEWWTNEASSTRRQVRFELMQLQPRIGTTADAVTEHQQQCAEGAV